MTWKGLIAQKLEVLGTVNVESALNIRSPDSCVDV